MKIIVLLILISLCIAGGFLLAFFWAVKDGQYEDDLTPSMRILLDDDDAAPLNLREQNDTFLENNSNSNQRNYDKG